MADATTQILAANILAADAAYTVAAQQAAAGHAAGAAVTPAALALLDAAEQAALTTRVEARVANQLHQTRNDDKSIRKRLERITPQERMSGRRFTGGAHEAGTIHQ